MTDGTYTYYTLQHRQTHESPWLKPDAPLKPVKKPDDWTFSSFDYFGHVANPWVYSGNETKPRFQASNDELHSVRCATGSHGWWTLKYAVQALRRVRKGSEEGKFDHKDSYTKRTQAARYEFRLVKVAVSKPSKWFRVTN